MHLERLAFNKLKIYLTLEELMLRGLDKEDIWKDSFKWHMLFDDLLEEASLVYGINIEGSVAVELFSVHSHGMIMIVTLEEQDDVRALNDGYLEAGYFPFESTLLFEFADFEDVIRLAHRLKMIPFTGGTLYYMDNKYFLYIEKAPFEGFGKLQANLAEFGQASLENTVKLHEYGKLLIREKAVEALVHYFK